MLYAQIRPQSHTQCLPHTEPCTHPPCFYSESQAIKASDCSNRGKKKEQNKTNKPHIVTLSKHCVDKTLKGKPLNSVDYFRNADLQHIKMMR